MLKLPKDITEDPRHDALVALLTTRAAPLWNGGRVRVPLLPMTPALAESLAESLNEDLACQGLELIGNTLAKEQKGLDALRRKAPESPQNARVSRVLFLSNDGSERFYRDCDALLARFDQRLIACRLNVSGAVLGEALLGEQKLVRGVLVKDRRAAARALFALLPEN